MVENETEDKKISEHSTAENTPNANLVTINTNSLNEESASLITQIIAETDVEKTKDLTYLFNLNQNKKTMIRVNKLNELQDNLTDLAIKRVTDKPDNMTTREVMDALKTVQDLIERGTAQVVDVNEQTPLITINQQNNEVHMDGEASQSRESREKVKNAVLDILNKAMSANMMNSSVIDATFNNKNDKENSHE